MERDMKYHQLHRDLYSIWVGMRQRCSNKNNKAYERYGGRGISVCEDWDKFENFVRDMNPRPTGHTLDRINNDGGYCKSNCRWATPKTQGLNKRVYKSNKYGISGITPYKGHYRVQIRRNGLFVINRMTTDFFNACCIKKSHELNEEGSHYLKDL